MSFVGAKKRRGGYRSTEVVGRAWVVVAGVVGFNQGVWIVGFELPPRLKHPAQKVGGTEQDRLYAEGLWVTTRLELVRRYAIAKAQDDVVEGTRPSVGYTNPAEATGCHCFVDQSGAQIVLGHVASLCTSFPFARWRCRGVVAIHGSTMSATQRKTSRPYGFACGSLM